ncbi:MAG TPA: hypothetical protein VHL14_10150, partial [Steroidobacteraceae bacterium]|nr:hypothetical protein [Steroidobacteraceae bacterium]
MPVDAMHSAEITIAPVNNNHRFKSLTIFRINFISHQVHLPVGGWDRLKRGLQKFTQRLLGVPRIAMSYCLKELRSGQRRNEREIKMI